MDNHRLDMVKQEAADREFSWRSLSKAFNKASASERELLIHENNRLREEIVMLKALLGDK